MNKCNWLFTLVYSPDRKLCSKPLYIVKGMSMSSLLSFRSLKVAKKVSQNGVLLLLNSLAIVNVVVIWDNVCFYRAALVRTWFINHPRFLALPLPPYSPFLNAIEEFFSAWRWKVYAHNPQAQIPLIQAMEEACGDIAPEAFQGWIRHIRRYFPHCLARKNIACDVDEVLWPDRNQRQDEA